MKCPICKKDALFVGVHDDEGNYHGLVGCDYERDPWSGLSYALHHEGWGECPLCTDGAYSTMGGMLFDTAEEAIASLTPPNEWVSVYDRLPEPGERVLATDCGFVGEFYINKRGKWQRYNVNCSELLMALDILYWMPLPAPPGKDNNAPTKKPNEPMTLEQLREMDGEPVWVEDVKHWALIDIEKGGQWDGVPFAIWAENGTKFTYNIKNRGLHCYRRPLEGEEDAQ